MNKEYYEAPIPGILAICIFLTSFGSYLIITNQSTTEFTIITIACAFCTILGFIWLYKVYQGDKKFLREREERKKGE